VNFEVMRVKPLLLSLFLLACAAHAQTAAPPAAPADETKGRAIRLKALDGKTYDTGAMPGEVVVASFGATWCAPCVWELKAVEELKEEYAGKPVRFLWVSIEDEERTPDSVLRHYAKTYRLTIPVLRDDGATFSQFTTNRRIPVVVFFDTEGRFDAPIHRGMSSDPITYKQMVRRRVDALLQARKAPAAAAAGAN
jgi:thiol-disulfide isomerase/thioredoxin